MDGRSDSIEFKWTAGTAKFPQDKSGISISYEIAKTLLDRM